MTIVANAYKQRKQDHKIHVACFMLSFDKTCVCVQIFNFFEHYKTNKQVLVVLLYIQSYDFLPALLSQQFFI